MERLNQILTFPPKSQFLYMARITCGFLLLFIIWSSVANLEEFAIAQGEIVPKEQIQSIQHLEGGIIEKMFVREGAKVQEGDELVQLNITSFVATQEELKARYQGVMLRKFQLEAQATNKEILEMPEEYKDFNPNIIKAELDVFASAKNKQDSAIRVLKDQLLQKELDHKQLLEEKISIERNIGLLRQKLSISNDLIKNKLTSKLENLQLKGEVQELDGRLSILDVAIPRAESAISEAKERIEQEKFSFEQEARIELSSAEVEAAQLTESMARAKDQVLRTTIKSPIAGVVKAVRRHTIGGVLQPGEVLMEIVPTGGNLLIDAKLNPIDIGFVRVGQKAKVKILTYDFARYGGLEGEVIDISADSHLDERTGQPYFRVKVLTDKNYLGKNEGELPITSGMQAMVDIHTGEKSVLAYFLKPVLKVREEAFRER